MKVVIAIDSFKGCASSHELAESIKYGIRRIYNNSEVVICPIADGGEGTVQALSLLNRAVLISSTCRGPVGSSVEAQYALLEDKTAIIEMASTSGLTLVKDNDL